MNIFTLNKLFRKYQLSTLELEFTISIHGTFKSENDNILFVSIEQTSYLAYNEFYKRRN